MHAGEEAGVRPRVVAGAVAERARIDVRESAEHGEVFPQWLERLQDRGQLELVAQRRGRPVFHVHAVGQIEKDHAPRRAADGCRGRLHHARQHALEERQRHAHTESAEEAATGEIEGFVGDVHGGGKGGGLRHKVAAVASGDAGEVAGEKAGRAREFLARDEPPQMRGHPARRAAHPAPRPRGRGRTRHPSRKFVRAGRPPCPGHSAPAIARVLITPACYGGGAVVAAVFRPSENFR